MSADQGWRAVLPHGERLLWHCRPNGGVQISDFFTPRLPFALVFTAFAIFWMAATSQMAQMGPASGGALDLFPLFGLSFMFVGLYMAFGIPFWDAYERRHSSYALTDEAAYIAMDLFGRRSLKRFPISDMNALEVEDGPQGTVWFNRDVRVYRKTSSYRTTNSVRQTHTTTTRTGFKCIDAPRTVYQMILGQMHSKRVDEAVTG
jgi:hypothetical protein